MKSPGVEWKFVAVFYIHHRGVVVFALVGMKQESSHGN